MTYKEKLAEKANNQIVEISKECIEFIKSEMELSYAVREYTIYLTKVDTSQDGVGNYGYMTLRIPRQFKPAAYCQKLVEELKKLGFDDQDIKSEEHDSFYRIQINW